MKPQITLAGSCMLFRANVGLQKSCGMKPQITSSGARIAFRSSLLQKSCGMKPQITYEEHNLGDAE